MAPAESRPPPLNPPLKDAVRNVTQNVNYNNFKSATDNNNDHKVRTVLLVKRVFDVSAILVRDKVQTTSLLTDAVINEAPW